MSKYLADSYAAALRENVDLKARLADMTAEADSWRANARDSGEEARKYKTRLAEATFFCVECQRALETNKARLAEAESHLNLAEAEAAMLRHFNAEAEALMRKDAERYRWLRYTAPVGIGDMARVRGVHSASAVDAAIDAAMGEKP